MQRHARAPRVPVVVLVMTTAMLLSSAVVAEEVSRLDLPRIAREVQTKGLADYIPVAYKTVGIKSQYWSPADNHARAHFLLFMAKDCSHFVAKWEIPALIPINQGSNQQRTLEPRNQGIYTRPGGGAKVLRFHDDRQNRVLNSIQVGPSVPVPLHWRVVANVFNLALKQNIAEMREAYVELVRGGDLAFQVLDVVVVVATASTVEGALLDFAIGALLDQLGIPDPTAPSTGWEACKWMLSRIVDKAERELGKLVNVRVLYMEQLEAFQLAPWTCVFLDGPETGTDTWDAIELRGGYKDARKYRWFSAAGAVTEWATYLNVRPSIFVRADVHYSCPAAECVIAPSQVVFRIVRDDQNWERLDRYLVENYLGNLNAPMFIVWVDPTINYELLDQEVMRWAGIETQDAGPSLSRRQLWRSGSICTGADSFIGRNRARIDFEARHPDAVHLAATVLPVEITFERAVMPVGGFMLEKGELRVQPTQPLLPSGTVGEHYCVNWYESTWWYRALADGKEHAEQRQKQMHDLLQDTAEHYRINWNLRADDWHAQIEHVTLLRRSQASARSRMIESNEKQWLATLGDGFRVHHGELTLPADSRLSSTLQAPSLRWRSVPRWAGLEFVEPIPWHRLVIDQPTVAPPPCP